DGGRSSLREQLGIGVRQRPYNQSALIANITPSEAHCGETFERLTAVGFARRDVGDQCALIVRTLTNTDTQLFAQA
ncbi:2-octaprenyl-6-methoxyphenyl hydroxylase, partial [Pseudomonas quasicaspiana]|nr:2-octaprenyl-6-methoxyphenyl hydroxylase [Pseudomonas quasicaspiana]